MGVRKAPPPPPPKPYTAVGLDPSLTGFGFAVVASERQDVFSEQFRSYEDTRLFTTKATGPERLHLARLWFESRLHDVRESFGVPDVVLLENYAFDAKWGREALAELGGIVRETLWCRYHGTGTKVFVVAPSTLKKWATGSGSAKKDQVLKAVYKRWGFDADTSDEADAYALAKLGEAIVSGIVPQHAYEREVIATVTDGGSNGRARPGARKRR